MSQRTITQQFEYLGAPLVNTRWSWGACNSRAVVLRVWQDRCKKIADVRYSMVARRDMYVDFDTSGSRERLQHLAEIEPGKPVYLIMCRVKDPSASPREIETFDSRFVWLGGELIEHDDDVWIELADKLPVAQARTQIME